MTPCPICRRYSTPTALGDDPMILVGWVQPDGQQVCAMAHESCVDLVNGLRAWFREGAPLS